MDNKMLVDSDIEEVDINNSSDEESEDENIKLEQRAEELEKQILDTIYSYDAHVELVKIYHKVLDLKSMREAYKRFANVFPLTDKLWLDWIKTEITVATNEIEKQNVLVLFQTAVKDYLSIELWLEYVQYSIGHSSLEDTRKVFEVAVSTGGLHISQGSLLWDAYREFEMVHLSLIPDKTSDAWLQQANKVIDIFKRQLSIPLLNIKDTYKEQQEWIKESSIPKELVNETGIEWAFKNSSKLLATYQKHENELLANDDRLTVYQNYIKDVKQPTHIICIYERIVAEFSLNSELWLQYYDYLQKLNMQTLDLLKRALRNCPWCEDLWVCRIRDMEMKETEFSEITSTLEEGLEAILPSHGLHLWLCYLEYCNRNASLPQDQIDQIFEQAKNHVGSGDSACTISRFHARVKANRNDMPGARQIWANILKHTHRGIASAWLEYATLERIKGTPDELRRIFQNALKSVKDWPQIVCEEWLMYERECGTLQTMFKCLEKCNAIPNIEQSQQQQTADTATDETNHTMRNGKRKRNENATGTFVDKRKKHSGAEREFAPKPEEEGKFASLTKRQDLKPELDIHALSAETTAFISNISSVVTEGRLRKMFPNAKQIDLMRDAKGKSRGHGYVQFDAHADVVEALTRDRESLDGRPIFISRFKPAKEERQHAFTKGREDNKLFVKGLPHSITQQQIEAIFDKFGPMKVRLVLQRSGRPKGLAYVEYSTEEQAAEALKATDNTTVGDCTISVAISDPPLPNKGSAAEAAGGDEYWRRERSKPFKSRLQMPLIPRVLATTKSAPSAAAAASTATSVPDAPPAAPKTNKDFRDMLLGKK